MSKLDLASRVPNQYDKATFADIVRAICGQVNPLSEGRLAARYNAQSVVPSTGDFAVGDFVPDSQCTVTAGNIRLGWVCVAPGSPGTLKEARVIVSGTAPTRTVLTTGSGTYSTPAGCSWIDVELAGGGSGGVGSGTSAGNGGAGGDTTFSTLTAGGAGAPAGAGGGAGGTATNGDVNLTGADGGQVDAGVADSRGGVAGGSFFGGAGRQANSGNAGGAAKANTGSGGAGAGCGATTSAGGAGAAGAYCRKVITNPAASYSYGVGDGGAAGTAGTSGFAGGAGAKGIIIITEHYN